MKRTIRVFCSTSAISLAAFGCGKKPAPNAEATATEDKAGNQKPPIPKRNSDEELIQGTWRVVAGESDGKKLPDEELKDLIVIFHGDQMLVKDHGVWDTQTFKLDPSKSPKNIDLEPEFIDSNTRELVKGKVELSIYELNGDDLKFAFYRDEKEKRPTEFQGQPGSKLSIFLLKREKDAKPYEPEKLQDPAEFPAAIIGKWKFNNGITQFPFHSDTEFTKDGRVLLLGYKEPKQWEEKYKYRFEKSVLVLTQPDRDGKPQPEMRVRMKAISKDEFIASSPSGKLIRMK